MLIDISNTAGEVIFEVVVLLPPDADPEGKASPSRGAVGAEAPLVPPEGKASRTRKGKGKGAPPKFTVGDLRLALERRLEELARGYELIVEREIMRPSSE